MNSNQNRLNDKLEIGRFVSRIREKWMWILSFIAIGIFLGFVISKYKKPEYKATATIKIDDKSSDMTDFLSIEMFADGFNQYDKILTESKILSSRTMIVSALDKLPLDVRYFKSGKISSYELYKKSPITLQILSNIDKLEPVDFEVSFHDKTNFKVEIVDPSIEDFNPEEFELSLDEPFSFNNVSYSIVKNRLTEGEDSIIVLDGSYIIKTINHQQLALEFAERLQVSQVEEKVSILKIDFISTNPLLCKDFVDALTTSYTRSMFEKKSSAAVNTLKFIDERLDKLTDKMSIVESEITKFKQDKKIIDFETVEQIETEKLIELESKKRIAELRIINLETVENEVRKGSQLSEISINAEGNVDPTLNQLITIFNELKIQKATLGINFTEDSKKGIEINRSISETIKLIQQSILISQKNVAKEIEYLDSKISVLNRRYNVFPENQRDYFHLIRDFEVNQKVLSFLMEKKIEASIANASLTPDIVIIDDALMPIEPISLSKLKLFLIPLIISILLGFSILIVIIGLDNKIYDKSILEETTSIPVLGAITRSSSDEYSSLEEILGVKRTIFRESVNSLRTNLRFIPESQNAKVISITSTISQEGKSFTLMNLAASLTLLNKSVVVVDLDMRKPKIQNYFGLDNTKTGVSLFLSDKASIDSIIQKTSFDRLDCILSGPIPPNPLELIQSNNFNELIEFLKSKYDYVMIDNPPIGIVSDAIRVMLLSDLNLYVVRSEYSRISFIETAVNAKEKHKLDNMYFILNGTKQITSGYYRNYSQGYYEESSEKKFSLLRKS